MGDLGLDTAYGAEGSSDAMQQIFQRRMAAAASARQQQQLDQTDALTRLKIQEQADEIRQRLEGQKQAARDRVDAAKAADQDRQDKQAAGAFAMNPVGADLGPTAGPRAQQLGFPVTKIAGPQVQQTAGFMPLPSAPSQGPGMQALGGLTPVEGPQAATGQSTTSADASSPLNAPATFTRGATQADVEKGKADDLASRKADDAAQARADALELRQHIADITDKVRSGQLNNQEAMLAIRERLASVAEQNASAKSAKGVQLSAAGKSSRAAIEQAAPLTDDAMRLMEKEFPGIATNPDKYNTPLDKIRSMGGAAKYFAGFDDPNDPRRQIVSLLQPVQAGQYMRSSRSRQMLDLTLKHMADMGQTPAAQYERLKGLKTIMPEMLEGIVRAEQPVDPSNPLAGSYFDPAKTAGGTKEIVYDSHGKPIK